MSIWNLVNIKAENWAPNYYCPIVQLLAPENYDGPRVALRDIAYIEVRPRLNNCAADALITPSNINIVTGQINRVTQGQRRDLISFETGLQINDVLVPLYHDAPAILVAETHKQYQFSGFAIVRASSSDAALYLWAVFTAARSLHLRLFVGDQMPGTQAIILNDLIIPWPNDSKIKYFASILKCFIPKYAFCIDTFHLTSTWKLLNLATTPNWSIAIHSIGLPSSSLRLCDFGAILQPFSERLSKNGHPIDGTTPLADIHWIQQGHPRHWVRPSSRSICVERSDVVVASIVTDNQAIVARVVTEASLVASAQVLIFRPHSHSFDDSQRIVKYLNSDLGRTLLRAYAVRSVVARLRPVDFGQVPVVDSIIERAGDADSRSLGEKLVEVLWL